MDGKSSAYKSTSSARWASARSIDAEWDPPPEGPNRRKRAARIACTERYLAPPRHLGPRNRSAAQRDAARRRDGCPRGVRLDRLEPLEVADQRLRQRVQLPHGLLRAREPHLDPAGLDRHALGEARQARLERLDRHRDPGSRSAAPSGARPPGACAPPRRGTRPAAGTSAAAAGARSAGGRAPPRRAPPRTSA